MFRKILFGVAALAALGVAGYQAQRWFYNPPRPVTGPTTPHRQTA